MSAQSRASLPYMPGLDGLRAIAVVAVVLYHGRDIQGIPDFLKPAGGFLGVEVFFVISGFLITALLLQEHEKHDTIDLKNFWIRRARRLLPALFLFLAATSVFALIFVDDAVSKIQREILGAVFYVSNWVQISIDESYFEAAGRPSLFRHLWSLAIEEQFYLLWPLVVWAALRYTSRRALLGLTLIGVAASTALLWWLFDGIDQYGDVTAVYYRTDARAAALLIGAALAIVWRPWRREAMHPLVTKPVVGWLLNMVGLLAVGAIIVFNYAFTDQVIEWSKYVLLYHGGFLVVSATTCLAIAAVAMPDSRLGWMLGNPVMRWIGMRSYGIYLWHWPVFQLTRPRLDVDLDGYALLGLRVVLTLALVELSYKLVESPIRQQRFRASVLQTVTTPKGIAVGTLLVLGVIASSTAVATAVPTIDRTVTASAFRTVDASAPAFSDAGTDRDASAQGDASAGTSTDSTSSSASPDEADARADSPATTPTATAEVAPTATAAAVPVEAPTLVAGNFEPVATPTPDPTPTQPPLPAPPPLSEPFDITTSQIHIIGDSVIQGAIGQLSRISPRLTIDARVGRQWWELEGEIRAMRAQGLANDVVVVQIGNNGSFNSQMFDGVMNALVGTRLVLFINIHAPVVWEAEVNQALSANVNRYPGNARLIDWYTASASHPEYFIEDGTHLQGPGMVAFRQLIESALVSLS